jgi:hypothetical protein
MTDEEFDQLPFNVQLAELVDLAQIARYHWRDQQEAAEELRHQLARMKPYDLNAMLQALEETLVQVRYRWRDRLVLE